MQQDNLLANTLYASTLFNILYSDLDFEMQTKLDFHCYTLNPFSFKQSFYASMKTQSSMQAVSLLCKLIPFLMQDLI